MFEQLRRAFGDPFYHKLEQAVRRLDDPGTSAKRKQLFQVEASKAANADLSDYFIRWGLRPDAQTLAAIKALGLKTRGRPSTVPVFKGSNEDRMLRLWGFGEPTGNYRSMATPHLQMLAFKFTARTAPGPTLPTSINTCSSTTTNWTPSIWWMANNS